VRASRPELLIDLMVNPADGQGGEDIVAASVWVVHEALWPGDRGAQSDSPLPHHRYLLHEYQGIGLGSLLRDQLGRRFPDRVVLFELAPLYLLRRVDAPSAGVVVSVSGAEQMDRLEHRREALLAESIIEAATDYIRSMDAFSF
jgi:hypothetical protein